MIAIKFKEMNCTFAENQPEYLPLPAYKEKTQEGTVISLWSLSFWERLKVLLFGKIWIHSKTFNNPLQPLYVSLDYPFLEKKVEA